MVVSQSPRDTSPLGGGWSLRRLLGIGSGLLVIVVASLAVAAIGIIGAFTRIERESAHLLGHRLERAYIAELDQIAVTAHSYAIWDDAAEFVASGGKKAGVASTFSAAVLGAMRVDFVQIVDASGNELYSGVLDRESGRLVSPAPAALAEDFAVGRRRFAQVAGSDSGGRLVHTRRGLAAFVAEPIIHSDGTRPSGGLLVFGRFFFAAEAEATRNNFHQDYAYRYLPHPLDDTARAGLPTQVANWMATPPTDDPALVVEDAAARQVVYVLARDVGNQPVALFSATQPPEAFALARRITLGILASIGALLLAMAAGFAWLLTRLERSHREVLTVSNRYSRIADQLSEGIAIVEADTGRVLAANQAVLDNLDCDRNSARSRTALDLYPDLTGADLAEAAQTRERILRTSRMRSAGGRLVDAEVSIRAVSGEEPVQLSLVGRDITHRREAEEQARKEQKKLAHIAQHDQLTGLPNRLFLRSRLPRALRHAARTDKRLALIYLDVDHFKNINDSRGHGVGDQLLRIVAARLRAAVAAHDVVVRMGGDEFVVIGSLLPDLAAAEALAQRLMAAICAPLVIDGTALDVSSSMGVAVHPDHGLDMDSLLKHADIALYEAKAAGRKCHRLFSRDMQVKVSESVALEQALRRALDEDQLTMDYQPVVDLRTGKLASLEALVRWRHPEMGFVPPSQFIPVAESCGLIIQLGNQALRKVIMQLREWVDAEVPIVPVAVNVSAQQLEAGDFDKQVLRLASEHGVDPRWLRFEITESALLKDAENLATTLWTLRTLGCAVLIDDFGTGYSGLSYLTRLPVDALKIDRSFISDMGRITARTPIIGAVIDMSRKLNLFTVAEGVETAEQAAMLRDQGCEYGQGYFFSKPVGPRGIRSLLEHLGGEKQVTGTVVARAISS